jgi:hypothetical protein
MPGLIGPPISGQRSDAVGGPDIPFGVAPPLCPQLALHRSPGVPRTDRCARCSSVRSRQSDSARAQAEVGAPTFELHQIQANTVTQTVNLGQVGNEWHVI